MKTSKIWIVNETPVISDTIEDAIATYKSHNFVNSKVDVTEAKQLVFDNTENCIISNNIE